MKVYAVVGTAPAHMGKCICEAKIETVLTSFVATRGDVPVPLDKLTTIMKSKMENNNNGNTSD